MNLAGLSLCLSGLRSALERAEAAAQTLPAAQGKALRLALRSARHWLGVLSEEVADLGREAEHARFMAEHRERVAPREKAS